MGHKGDIYSLFVCLYLARILLAGWGMKLPSKLGLTKPQDKLRTRNFQFRDCGGSKKSALEQYMDMR